MTSARYLCVLLLLQFPVAAAAQRATFPQPPPSGVYRVDEAGIIGPDEAAEVDRIAAGLLTETDVPIVVVTLRTLASHGAAGYTIERYAQELFNVWGLGSPDRNYGMLLLVSPGDRAARIELGAGWRRAGDQQATEIMNDLINGRNGDLYSAA